MNSFYHKARFLTSASKLSETPPDLGYEVAFAGRSNAGKSSAINALSRQKQLARTSKTPGRTQLLNFFLLDEQRRMVDLPGYGYAKVPESVKQKWQQEMARYLAQRKSLKGVVLLMDIRHPLQPFDLQMLDWAEQIRLPLHILLTKADKLSRGAANTVLFKIRDSLHKRSTSVTVQLFSAVTREGMDQLCEALDNWLAVDRLAETAQPV